MTHNPRLRNLENAELYLTASNVTASVAQIDNFTSENVLVNQATIYGRNNLSQTPNQAFIEYSSGDDKLVLFPGMHLSGNLTVQGTISSSGNITTAGDLAVNGGDITSTQSTLNIDAGGTVRIKDNLIVDGDLAVNGGDITSTQNTLNINAGGTVNVQDDLTVQGTISSSGVDSPLFIRTSSSSSWYWPTFVPNTGYVPVLIDSNTPTQLQYNPGLRTLRVENYSGSTLILDHPSDSYAQINGANTNLRFEINNTTSSIEDGAPVGEFKTRSKAGTMLGIGTRSAIRTNYTGSDGEAYIRFLVGRDNNTNPETIAWFGTDKVGIQFFKDVKLTTPNLSINGADYIWPSSTGASQTNVFLKNDNKTLSWVPIGYSNDVATVVGNHTLNTITEVLLVNNTTAVTITLPTAVGNIGKFYDIKRIGTAAVTITGSAGQTIDGASNYILNTAYQTVTLVTNGTNWFIL